MSAMGQSGHQERPIAPWPRGPPRACNLAEPRLFEQRQGFLLEVQHALLIDRPRQQRAVDPDPGQISQSLDDLLLGADQGERSPPSHEMRLQLAEILYCERANAKEPHQILGGNPIAFFVHVIMQEILGLLLGLALHDIAKAPDLDVAAIFLACEPPILVDLGAGEIEIVPVELDEGYVGVFGGKVLALLRPAGS
jgi:hypothetical protein